MGNRRGTFASDGMRGGLLDSLPEREELCRRMQRVDERDRKLLFLWYLRELPAIDIARELRISRRQCFRRRAAVIRRLVELGEPAVASAATDPRLTDPRLTNVVASQKGIAHAWHG